MGNRRWKNKNADGNGYEKRKWALEIREGKQKWEVVK